ncbi:MAG: hypothetical protein R2849_13655 [Thermomicrobiales bacterium]
MTNSYDSQNTSSDSILGYLQELVLIAVMLGERLPGTRRPIQIFPRGHRLREIPMKIVQSNLAQSLKLDELPRRLDVLALDEPWRKSSCSSTRKSASSPFGPPSGEMIGFSFRWSSAG